MNSPSFSFPPVSASGSNMGPPMPPQQQMNMQMQNGPSPGYMGSPYQQAPLTPQQQQQLQQPGRPPSLGPMGGPGSYPGSHGGTPTNQYMGGPQMPSQ